MNKQVYADYTNYIKYAGQVPTYCNVYFEDVFKERLELPTRLFHYNPASDVMTEEGLSEFFLFNLEDFRGRDLSTVSADDLEPYRVTYHEDFEIIHIVEEADRITNYEAFWENCGWRFGNLSDKIEIEAEQEATV